MCFKHQVWQPTPGVRKPECRIFVFPFLSLLVSLETSAFKIQATLLTHWFIRATLYHGPMSLF